MITYNSPSVPAAITAAIMAEHDLAQAVRDGGVVGVSRNPVWCEDSETWTFRLSVNGDDWGEASTDDHYPMLTLHCE